ncbi:helix-turn-helix domain-containing protein [Caulobacter segnis]
MPDTALRRDVWLLDAGDQDDAFEQYRKGCAHLFDITLQSPEATFFNSLEAYHLGVVVLAKCSGVPQRFERKLSHILVDGGDTVMVVVELEDSGWRGDYDGRAAGGHMGQIRLVDMARPFEMTTGGYRSLYVMVPRALLEGQGGLDFHGLVVSEDSVSGRLLSGHIQALSEVADRMTPDDAEAAAKAIVALIGGAIAAHAAPATDDPRPVEKMLLALGRQFVERNLDDVELSPEAVRRHLAVSRSLLYKVFEPVGGVSAFIQGRRLDQAFDAILHDRAEQHTLGEIGYRHGFRSDAHFSRAFRGRFGVTPGRLRRVGEAARQEGLSALERPDDVFTWLRGL